MIMLTYSFRLVLLSPFSLPTRKNSHDFAHEKNTKAPEGTATGATTGGVIGGALGLLAGLGTLAIPVSVPLSRPVRSSRRSPGLALVERRVRILAPW